MDGNDLVKVESLVQDFLSAQSLKVLPQGPFGEAVNQFVAKDDKHAMELFVSEHLSGQVRQMLGLESDDEDLNSAMEIYRTRVEQQVTSGLQPSRGERQRVLRAKPATWDSDFDGNWEDEPDAWTFAPADDALTPTTTQAGGRSISARGTTQSLVVEEDEPAPAKTTRRGAAARTTKAAPAKKPAAKAAPKTTRGRRKQVEEQEEEEDVVMESDEEPEAPPPKTTRRGAAAKAKPAAPGKRTATRASGRGKQTTLNFSQKGATQNASVEISDDEISDDDAFEPVATSRRR